MIGERFYTGFFDLLEDAHEIAAEDLLDIALRESAFEQTLRDPRQSGRCLEILGQRRNAVEVAPHTDVVDARDFSGVDEMIDDVLELKVTRVDTQAPCGAKVRRIAPSWSVLKTRAPRSR